jgi:S-adenosylmethionine:tRNA ribosyltransferase-isomerase
MKLSDFKFEVPKKLIALHPSPNRDESRLMVVHRKTGQIEHRVFKDITEYFQSSPQDCTETKKKPEQRLKYSFLEN